MIFLGSFFFIVCSSLKVQFQQVQKHNNKGCEWTVVQHPRNYATGIAMVIDNDMFKRYVADLKMWVINYTNQLTLTISEKRYKCNKYFIQYVLYLLNIFVKPSLFLSTYKHFRAGSWRSRSFRPAQGRRAKAGLRSDTFCCMSLIVIN